MRKRLTKVVATMSLIGAMILTSLINVYAVESLGYDYKQSISDNAKASGWNNDVTDASMFSPTKDKPGIQKHIVAGTTTPVSSSTIDLSGFDALDWQTNYQPMLFGQPLVQTDNVTISDASKVYLGIVVGANEVLPSDITFQNGTPQQVLGDGYYTYSYTNPNVIFPLPKLDVEELGFVTAPVTTWFDAVEGRKLFEGTSRMMYTAPGDAAPCRIKLCRLADGLTVDSLPEHLKKYVIAAPAEVASRPYHTWQKDSKGWRYIDQTGHFIKSARYFIDETGALYRLKDDGYMAQNETVGFTKYDENGQEIHEHGAIRKEDCVVASSTQNFAEMCGLSYIGGY